jgi:hypothetical protein
MTEKNIDFNFESVIDKIIETTEKNLTMQSEFLKAIYELKHRFDSIDRDHKDSNDDIKAIKANSFTIIEKMKMASNETIIEMVQDLIKQIDVLEKINANIECLQNDKAEKDNQILELREFGKNIKTISSSWTMVKVIMSLIGGFLILATAIFGFWQKNQFDSMRKEFIDQVKKSIPAEQRIDESSTP